ncbi:MAG: hypothetical protein AAFZ07_14025 [Actinomycetota bacterium]
MDRTSCVGPARHLAPLLVAVAVLAAACDAGDERPAEPVGTAPAATVVAATDARSVTGERPPTITVDDRTQILTMLAVDRATVRTGLGSGGGFDTVYVIEAVGDVDPLHADVRFEPGSPPFTSAERAAITAALAPLPVAYVDSDWSDTAANVDRLDGERAALIGFAAPQLAERRVQVASFVLCGGFCGTGSLDRLERTDDGTWRIAGTMIDWVA